MLYLGMTGGQMDECGMMSLVMLNSWLTVLVRQESAFAFCVMPMLAAFATASIFVFSVFSSFSVRISESFCASWSCSPCSVRRAAMSSLFFSASFSIFASCALRRSSLAASCFAYSMCLSRSVMMDLSV